MEKHEHFDETDTLNAELDRIAQEDAEAESLLIATLIDNSFTCAECGNQFEIEDSYIWRGVIRICKDCADMLEQMATAEPENLD